MTRSVRRIPKPWSLDELGQVEITPQECLFGMLGTKLAAPKRVAPPEALPAVALPRVVTAAGNTMTPFSSDEAASLCFSTPVASASTPSSVPVALHAPGIGDTMMIADVLPQAGQAVPATMKPPPPMASVAGPAAPVAARGHERSDGASDEATSQTSENFLYHQW